MNITQSRISPSKLPMRAVTGGKDAVTGGKNAHAVTGGKNFSPGPHSLPNKQIKISNTRNQGSFHQSASTLSCYLAIDRAVPVVVT